MSHSLVMFEELEPRVMLSGVTLIAHGYGLMPGNSMPAWESAMAEAVVDRAGSASTVAEYTLTVWNGVGDGTDYRVKSFDIEAGSPEWSEASSGETVIKIDWTDLDGGIPGVNTVPTQDVAGVVADWLASHEIDGLRLAEVPIHLIGFSRGGSLVGALAEDLGAKGIWVDQVTFLDPHPVGEASHIMDDWGYESGLAVPSNVVFADNYYHDYNPVTPVVPGGDPVLGAKNVDLTGIVTGSGAGTAHGQIHTY